MVAPPHGKPDASRLHQNVNGLRRARQKQIYESLEGSDGGALEGRNCSARAGVWLIISGGKVRASESVVMAIAELTSASKCSSQHIAIGAFRTFSTTARGRCFGPRLWSSDGFLIPKITRKNKAIRMTFAIRRFLFI